MRIDRGTRRALRLQHLSFLVLFVGAVALLAWLSTRYAWEADWTAAGRNSLSEATLQVLERLEGPVDITAFAREGGGVSSRRSIGELLGRYRRHYPDLRLRFVNPDTAPGLTRQLGISAEGELVLEYQGRSEHVRTHAEEALTNALQRLQRGGDRRLAFLSGHGERSPTGRANHDLGAWAAGLRAKGISAEMLHLGEGGGVPDEADILVVASPQVELLDGETALIRAWVADGGNLLWLLEPGGLQGLGPLAEDLGSRPRPGVIVDPTTQLLGLADPSFALITGYPEHPITRGLQLMTILPQACALETEAPEGWEGAPFLATAPRSWTETGPLQGTIEQDPDSEAGGPLTVGFALNRTLETEGPARRVQRVALICDGDFLSNTYLGNQGNENLGQRVVNWLAGDDAFISIPPRTAPDTRLALSERAWAWLGLFFLLGVPLGLLGSGALVWWRRRRR